MEPYDASTEMAKPENFKKIIDHLLSKNIIESETGKPIEDYQKDQVVLRDYTDEGVKLINDYSSQVILKMVNILESKAIRPLTDVDRFKMQLVLRMDLTQRFQGNILVTLMWLSFNEINNFEPFTKEVEADIERLKAKLEKNPEESAFVKTPSKKETYH